MTVYEQTPEGPSFGNLPNIRGSARLLPPSSTHPMRTTARHSMYRVVGDRRGSSQPLMLLPYTRGASQDLHA